MTSIAVTKPCFIEENIQPPGVDKDIPTPDKHCPMPALTLSKPCLMEDNHQPPGVDKEIPDKHCPMAALPCSSHSHHYHLNHANVQLTQHYLYYFEIQSLSPGQLITNSQSITFIFPKNLKLVDYSVDYFKNNFKNIQFFINNVLIFDTHWIPLYTPADWFKFTDMMYKGYCDYVTKTYYLLSYFWESALSSEHSENRTTVKSNFYTLYCSENVQNTVIKLEIPCNQNKFSASHPCSTTNNCIPVLQFYLNDELYFCSQTMLYEIPPHEQSTVVACLLSKLIKK